MQQHISKSLRFETMALVGIYCLIGIAFLPCVSGDFLNWDDNYYITANAVVTGGLNLTGLKQLLIQCVCGIYTPLTTLSFLLEYSLFGANPFIFHINNLLLHGAVTWLIFFLAVRLGLDRRAGFAAALIFAVHPMHVESVAWITERKDVLYAAFYLLSIHRYLDYVQTRRLRSYGYALAFAFLSVLAKPMALSLPLIMLLLDWYLKRGFRRRIWMEKIPFVVCMAVVAGISFLLNARNPIQEMGQAFLIWAWSLSFYLWKFVWPVGLSPLYALPEPVTLANGIYAAAMATLFLVVVLTVKFRRHRLWVFAVLYFFLSIFFLLRYDSGVDKNIVADRFMYLPSAGFCMFLGALLGQCVTSAGENRFAKWRAWGLGGGLIVLLAVGTFCQSRIWKDPLALWNHVIAKTPSAYVAYNNRGNIYFAAGRYDPALADYNTALTLNSQYAKGYNNRGVLYAATGQIMPALDDFNQAVRYDREFAEPYLNRSMILAGIKNYRLALAEAKKAQARGIILPDGYLAWLERQSEIPAF